MEFCGLSIVRGIQILLSVLGLIFSLTSDHFNALLVLTFVITVLYETTIVISFCLGKTLFTPRTRSIIDVILGVIILVFTIYCAFICTKDVMLKIVIVIGFIIPPLLFISAYE